MISGGFPRVIDPYFFERSLAGGGFSSLPIPMDNFSALSVQISWTTLDPFTGQLSLLISDDGVNFVEHVGSVVAITVGLDSAGDDSHLYEVSPVSARFIAIDITVTSGGVGDTASASVIQKVI